MPAEINTFRKNHLTNILNLFVQPTCPLDLFLAGYFRAHKAIGSKDRRFISDTAYGIIRWQGLIDHFLKDPISWQARIDTFLSLKPESHLQNPLLPPHVKVSFPKLFYDLLSEYLGEELAKDFCFTSNFPAPTTVRVNTLKTTRASLLERWTPIHQVSPTTVSPYGILFHRKVNFLELPEFKEGLFEIQDEASQLITDLVRAQPGQLVLDFCAGSGGKTLGFAHKLAKRGQIYLHDIRSRALTEARKRLARAGIQNAQILLNADLYKRGLQGKMDWVLIDAPCSGTGTLRRNPDMKWKFQIDHLQQLIELQRTIVSEALTFLKPGGHCVYATCSILPQENDQQLDFFLNHFPLELVETPLRTFPQKGAMDGFFGVILRKTL
ncbi:MAG: RsmB/NOP family class I SAM-dependent RNA methyltransferase [Simkania sp.]|nr:RsmB/NOP family class I SAM-dependent RNA methyltransferase [Simkania sp.]